MRQRVATIYGQGEVKVTADDVIIANATTGANLLVLQGLISPGDHVVVAYPAYGSLDTIPKGIGAEVSYWNLNPENDWKGNLDDLKSLLRPSTKMLILNNPHNPTGSVLSTSEQAEIVKLATEHNTIVFTDEIFRPLFHTDQTPTSMVEHDFYDRTIVTGSLSKAWGMSGVRIGWVVTRNPQLRKACIGMKEWTLQSVSLIDKVVAKEVLSERCRDRILSKNLAIAHENLATLQDFLPKHKQTVSCSVPTGAATAFVKFSGSRSGHPVDDLEFCRRLKQETGVLLSPGSLCFGPAREGDFRGYIRLHITKPDVFREGLEKIGSFIESSSYAALDS